MLKCVTLLSNSVDASCSPILEESSSLSKRRQQIHCGEITKTQNPYKVHKETHTMGVEFRIRIDQSAQYLLVDDEFV
jgi:hypothetical protein